MLTQIDAARFDMRKKSRLLTRPRDAIRSFPPHPGPHPPGEGEIRRSPLEVVARAADSAAPLPSLLAPLEALAQSAPHYFSRAHGWIEHEDRAYALPRFLFRGPEDGGEVVRIGIFAGIHGDEPEGTYALLRFVSALAAAPQSARGYALYIYPVCNPSGFEAGTRHARAGRDLNREFWKDSAEMEVRLLEAELYLHAFDGLITLHSDDTSHGLYGYVKGAVLSEHLLEPALRAAERFLPRDERDQIDGWAAQHGIIREGFDGMMQSPPGMSQPPFEITLETPQRAPLHRQVEAFNAALQAILAEYRPLLAFAQNI